MKLEGIHHITAITADAPRNVDFYARVLGLRLVKKTVNFDAPDVYHLYYGDEAGSPGSILTFFEFPGAALGRPGAGMIHRIVWRAPRRRGRRDRAGGEPPALRRSRGPRAGARARAERRPAASRGRRGRALRARAAGLRRGAGVHDLAGAQRGAA